MPVSLLSEAVRDGGPRNKNDQEPSNCLLCQGTQPGLPSLASHHSGPPHEPNPNPSVSLFEVNAFPSLFRGRIPPENQLKTISHKHLDPADYCQKFVRQELACTLLDVFVRIRTCTLGATGLDPRAEIARIFSSHSGSSRILRRLYTKCR